MNSSMNQFSILKNSDLQEYSGGLNPTCGVLVGMSIYIGLTAFTGPVGVAFTQSFRYFYEFFSRELLPGGIILSEQARKDFSRISDLANSTELLKTIHSPIKIFW